MNFLNVLHSNEWEIKVNHIKMNYFATRTPRTFIGTKNNIKQTNAYLFDTADCFL